MSCNGCRVLRKGCSDTCILRPCLQWIETAEAQGHATVFLAKFFGRAGLMSFISAVPETQRPALFQSLLYEACGRTVNPVHGAVGLLWTGNWNVCQAAVETVLKEGTLRPASSLPKIANTYQCSRGIPIRSSQPEEAMLSLSSPPPPNSSKLMRHSEDQQKHADNFARNSKRSRSSDLESSGGTKSECFNKGASTWSSKPGFLNERSENLGKKVEMMKSEQCQQSSGQLLAPVPKKANMRMQESEIVTSLRSVGTPHQAIRASERIDLDLTLSFPAFPTGSGIVGDGRVSSPNISVLSINSNSEGSVTSLDTLDLPASLNPPSSKQEHKLLDLLP